LFTAAYDVNFLIILPNRVKNHCDYEGILLEMLKRGGPMSFFTDMVEEPLSNRIQKTTIFLVLALAMVGAFGAMTWMMITAATADATHKPCRLNRGGFICPQESAVCPWRGTCHFIPGDPST
jgi:hypothetical protein